MDDQTVMVESAGERTEMFNAAPCPVCGQQNAPGEIWCAECGFRLGSTPGEAAAPAPEYALEGGGERHPLKPGENVVGRLNADVFLSDPSVSRRHAVILVGPEGVFVRDENSSNGTRMNNVRIAPGAESPLQPGETVQFGAVQLTLEGPGEGPLVMPPAPDLHADAPAPQATVRPVDSPRETLATLTDGVETWPLHAGLNTIGRRPDNDVHLTDPAVSGRHATLTIEDGMARIADAGSTNGTFVSETRLVPGAEQAISPGVALRFGRVVLNYEAVPLEVAPALEQDETPAEDTDGGCPEADPA